MPLQCFVHIREVSTASLFLLQKALVKLLSQFQALQLMHDPSLNTSRVLFELHEMTEYRKERKKEQR